ncbi:tRNA (5-methylaminomethyl-2-thiouridine)(34)-methyltransferase MnmD [Lyngbya confervoides]|uniref:MnmC family methyltransferase n=1 Tax=Lyngbya confervoides BDU141951 TaxID=1574623 RepID=A0ABD4T9W3_9CYAN|nr:MnmC family methyltransferase [Lyngbya confervoides]MCM1985085.1 MnmC family methyltransferase [Lyngbya confervoides BDU141951]
MSVGRHLLTQDGSYTFYSGTFGESYHTRTGAKTEAFEKFVNTTRIRTVALTGTVALLDVCYGLGYNTAAAVETIWQINPHCQIQLYGLELDPTVPQAATKLKTHSEWPKPIQKLLLDLAWKGSAWSDRLQAELLIGDARATIQSLLARSFQADAIFLDPFSPQRCPQLWTADFFAQVVRCLKPMGTLATYSRSAAVRSALRAVGLHLGTVPVVMTPRPLAHHWSQGTVARWLAEDLIPLSTMELEHLQTRAGIVLRDPTLTGSAEEILARQHQAQQVSSRESTSSWRRRWKIQ